MLAFALLPATSFPRETNAAATPMLLGHSVSSPDAAPSQSVTSSANAAPLLGAVELVISELRDGAEQRVWTLLLVLPLTCVVFQVRSRWATFA